MRRMFIRAFDRKYLYVSVMILIIYAYFCGSELAVAKESNLNLGEYMLLTLTEQYYLIYGWFFFLIFDVTVRIKREGYLEKIRYLRIKKYYQTEVFYRVVYFSAMGLMHILIPLCIGITKLPLCGRYSETVLAGVYDGRVDVLIKLNDVFLNPVFAFICVWAYFTFGSIIISLILFYVYQLFNKPVFVCVEIIAICSTVTGFLNMGNNYFENIFFLNKYYIFHHAFEDGLFLTILRIPVLLGVMYLLRHFAIKKHGKNNDEISYISALFNINVLYAFIILVFLFVLGIVRSVRNNESLLWEWTKGFSYKSFSLTEMLYYVAFEFLILFLVNMMWEKEKKDRNVLAMYRVGSSYLWNKLLHAGDRKFIFWSIGLYYLVSLAVLVLCFFAGQQPDTEILEYYGVGSEWFFYIQIVTVIAKGVEIYILFVADKIFYKLTNNTICSYCLLICLFLLGFVFKEWWYFGKGSAYQLLELIGGK